MLVWGIYIIILTSSSICGGWRWILTKKSEVTRWMTDELDEWFTHRPAECRMWRYDIRSREQWEHHADTDDLQCLQCHVFSSEARQTLVPDRCQQLLDVGVCHELKNKIEIAKVGWSTFGVSEKFTKPFFVWAWWRAWVGSAASFRHVRKPVLWGRGWGVLLIRANFACDPTKRWQILDIAFEVPDTLSARTWVHNATANIKQSTSKQNF